MADSDKKITLLTEQDLYLFNEGSHFRLHEKLGSHVISEGGLQGTYFAVWAPDAEKVFVMGDFNGWSKDRHSLQPKGRSGIWEGFIPGVDKGARYKYHVVSRYQGYRVDKADPFAFYNDPPPETASMTWTTPGMTRSGWQTAVAAFRQTPPFPSTNFTWGRG